MKPLIDQSNAERPGLGTTRTAALRSLLDTVAISAGAAWMYVAAIAVFRAHQLPQPFSGAIPVRIDTLGIFAFAISAAAFFIREITTQPGWAAVARTVLVYSSATAIYLTGNAISHPETMPLQLTHLLGWPSERTTLIFALLASIVSFYFLRLAAHVRQISERARPC